MVGGRGAPSGLDVSVNGVRSDWEHEERVTRENFSENRRRREAFPAFDYQGRRCLLPDGTIRAGTNVIEIGPCADAEIVFAELQLGQ